MTGGDPEPRLPADGLTIAVLERGAPARGFGAPALLIRLARAALGLPSPQLPAQASPPATLLAACAGDYDLEGATLRFESHDGQLWVRLPGREEPLKLLWAGGSRFLGTPDGYDPDEGGTFLLAGDRAVAVSWGHRLLLEGLAKRRPAPPQ